MPLKIRIFSIPLSKLIERRSKKSNFQPNSNFILLFPLVVMEFDISPGEAHKLHPKCTNS